MDVWGCEKVLQGVIPSVLPALTNITSTCEGVITNAIVPIASDDTEFFNLINLQGDD